MSLLSSMFVLTFVYDMFILSSNLFDSSFNWCNIAWLKYFSFILIPALLQPYFLKTLSRNDVKCTYIKPIYQHG